MLTYCPVNRASRQCLPRRIKFTRCNLPLSTSFSIILPEPRFISECQVLPELLRLISSIEFSPPFGERNAKTERNSPHEPLPVKRWVLPTHLSAVWSAPAHSFSAPLQKTQQSASSNSNQVLPNPREPFSLLPFLVQKGVVTSGRTYRGRLLKMVSGNQS